MKGDRLGGCGDVLRDLHGRTDCAVYGPAGLYLRTRALTASEPLFSRIDSVDAIAVGEVFSGVLAGFEEVFVKHATRVDFDEYALNVASPPYLALEYLLTGRPTPDLCAFVKAGGCLEPEVLRNSLKSVGKEELFHDQVLRILYDFGSTERMSQ